MLWNQLPFATICSTALCSKTWRVISAYLSPRITISTITSIENIDCTLYILYKILFLCRTKGTIDRRHRRQDLHCQTSAIAHSWSNIIFYFTTQTTLVFSTNLAQRTFLLKFLFHLVCLFAFQLLLFIPLCSLLQWSSKNVIPCEKSGNLFEILYWVNARLTRALMTYWSHGGFSAYRHSMSCWIHFSFSLWINSLKL